MKTGSPISKILLVLLLAVLPLAAFGGNAVITQSGSTWTLENDVLRSVIVFANGGIDMTSFYNKTAGTEYLTGTGARHLFQYTFDGNNLTANGGGWTLGAATVADINVYNQVWGQRLAVNVSMSAPEKVNVTLIFEIYNGAAGLKYSTFIQNNDGANQKAISSSDVLALNFPNTAHTLYYVPQAIAWTSTTGSLVAAKKNCLCRYGTGDGWVLSPENNTGTSLTTGAFVGDVNNPFLFIDAWNGAPANVRVYSNPNAVQLVLFPREQVEYFSVNLEVFQGDVWNGRLAAATHLRQRFKYHDPSRILSINDWYFSGGGSSRPESRIRSAIVPAMQQMGFDTLQIDDLWNVTRDSTTANAQAFTSNLPALASWVNTQGLNIGYWFSLNGDYWGLGRDLGDPNTIAYKENQMTSVLIGQYNTKWQQIDLGETFMTGTVTSYSHPSDSVYRKFLGFRNYTNYITDNYPDILLRETCEFENVPEGPGSACLMAINDNSVSGLFGGANNGLAGPPAVAEDLFSYFGLYPAEGMMGCYSGYMNNYFNGTVNHLCQMLTARDIGVYSDPSTFSSQELALIGKFTTWMHNPRMKSVLNQIACPTSFGGTFDNLTEPYLWMFVNQARDTAILTGESTYSVPSATANLRWLDSGTVYLVEDISLNDDGVFQYKFKGKQTGANLKSPGFTVNFNENTTYAKTFWIQALTSTNPQVLYADANITGYTQHWNGAALMVNVTGSASAIGTVVVYKDSIANTEVKHVVMGPDGTGTVSFDASTVTPPAIPLVDLATSGTASASSTSGAGLTASNVNDGNLTTRWNSASGQTTNQWLEIDFSAATTFDKVVTREHTADGCGQRIQSYQIQYWNGSGWASIASGNTVGLYKADTFAPVTASKVRLYIFSASNLPTIDELQIFNTKSPAVTWSGSVNGTWDNASTANWTANGTPTTYGDGDNVTFDDTATGTTLVNNLATVSPASVTVNNTADAYVIGGSPIAGLASLTKLGTNTLTLTGVNTYTGPTIVNGGTLVVNGSITFLATVNSGGTLSGTGATGMVTVNAGGTLAPGWGGAGQLGLGGNSLSLAGTCAIQVNASTAAGEGVQGISTVNYGGTLTVTNLAGTFAAGSTFTLFSAGAYAGSFTALILPALPAGLAWNTSNLAVDGSITVVNQVFTSVTVSPAAATIAISGTQQFTATGCDQYGNVFLPQPVFTWSNSGVGTVNGSGLYVGPATPGLATLVATSGGLSGSATVSVVPPFSLWTGGGGNSNWSTAANWSGGVAPLAGARLVFTGAATNDFASGTAFNVITLQGSNIALTGSQFTIAGANAAITSTGTNDSIAQAIQLGSNVTISATGGALSIGGAINNSGYQLTVAPSLSSTVSLQGVVSGTGGLVESGSGGLNLTALNTYTGGTIVSSGTLTLPPGGSTGIIRGGLTINSGATVNASQGWALGYGNGTCVNAITINGGTLYFTYINSGDQGGTSASSITMTGGTITGNQFDLYNGITTKPTITTNASATPSVISAGMNLRVSNTGTVTFNIARGSGTMDLLISGTINNGYGSGAGGAGGNIVKTGSGVMVLTASNSYTGATAVNGGTLIVNGNNSTSATAVNSGGTLAGTGTIGALTVTSGGTLAPGIGSTGALSMNNSALALAGTCAMEINGSTGACDEVQGISSVTYGGTLSVTNVGGTPTAGETFTLFSAGAHAGAFASIVLPALPSSLQWNTSNLGSNGSISVAYTPWGQWQAGQFTTAQLANPSVSGLTATATGDGIPNLMKYALSLSAMANGAGGLPNLGTIASGGSNYLTLTYTQVISATDITYRPEVSGDLQTWNSGSGYIAPVSVTTNPGGITQTVTVRDMMPMTGGVRRFMRLNVTQP